MDINTVRGLLTAILIVIFVVLYFWAFSKRRQADFNEAAMLPFAGDEQPPQDVSEGENHE